MAAVNKNKLLDNATKYIQKGQIDRAIKELQKVIEADPADVRTRLKLGDLFAKKNQNAEAAEQYTLVAESYSKDGFYLKAVAVYKQILKLDSSLIDVHLKLGDLYHQLGLLSDAMGQYQIVVQHYDQKGMSSESLAVLRKMVELDPENVQSRKKLAEIIAREGNQADAIAEFQKIAEELKAKGRLDDLAGVLERIVHLDSANLDVVRELAALYLDRGDPKRALAKLQICFRANPQDLSTLEMLSKAFVALGQPEKAKSVLREISKIHQSAGNNAAMMEANRGILQIDPADAEARAAVEGRAFSAEPSSPEYSAPAPQPSAMPARASAPESSRPASVASASAQPLGSVSPDDPQTIQKLLTEADVYLKYGLLEKALDHLRGIVRRNPSNVDAHLKLKDVYLQHKDIDSAANEIVAVVDLCVAQGDTQRAAEALSEGLGFAPGNAVLEAKQSEIGGGGSAAPASNWDAPPGDGDSVEISIDSDSDLGDGDVLIDEPATSQIEASIDVGTDEDEGSVEIHLDGNEGEGTEAEIGAPNIVDESVDVSVIDDVAIEPADADIIVDPGPALEDEPEMAEVVSLDSRREPSGGNIRMPEPSALSPDQLLNELATAFEPTGGPSLLEDDEASISLDDAAGALDDDKPSEDFEISVDGGLEIEDEIEIEPEPEPVAPARMAAPAPKAVEKPVALETKAPVTPPKARADRFLDEPVVEAAKTPAPVKPPAVVKPPVEDVVIEEPLDLPTDDDIAVEEAEPIVAARVTPPVDVKAPAVSATSAKPAAAVAAKAAPGPSAAGNDTPVPAEVMEDVDEADFFVKQEIYDEAIAVYKRLLKKYPGNGGLTKRLERAEAYMRGEKPDAAPVAASAAPTAPLVKAAPVKAEAAPKPAAVVEPPPSMVETVAASNGVHPPEAVKTPPPKAVPEETGGFDLAAELGDIFEDIEEEDSNAPAFDENEQVSVGDVLREFRKGIDAQIGTEDKEARYNLGIAYREMGLLDEAIGEFQIAGEDTIRKADCLSMIGICQRDKGDYAASVQSFSAAIKTPGTNEKQKASFFYELATTLELDGQPAKAQKMLQQVQALDPGFRDVAEKLGGSKNEPAVANKKISFI